MNDLVINLASNIAKCDTKEVSKQIMSVCRAITPQFYKSMSVEEVKAERLGIELALSQIEQSVVSEMCMRAILDYPKRRSLNNACYFNINYILEYYIEAFNFIHSESIALSKNAELLNSHFDKKTSILTQQWCDNGSIVETKEITSKEQPNIYTQKYLTNILRSDFDDIDV